MCTGSLNSVPELWTRPPKTESEHNFALVTDRWPYNVGTRLDNRFCTVVLYGSGDVVFVKLTMNVLTAMMWYVYKVLYRLSTTFILFYRAIPKHWTFLHVYFKVHLHCAKANAKSMSLPGGFLESSICCLHRATKQHKKTAGVNGQFYRNWTDRKGPFTLSENEHESDVASRWVDRESNLMFTVISDKDQRKKCRFHVRYQSV